jgi:hypothetical protein
LPLSPAISQSPIPPRRKRADVEQNREAAQPAPADPIAEMQARFQQGGMGLRKAPPRHAPVADVSVAARDPLAAALAGIRKVVAGGNEPQAQEHKSEPGDESEAES